MNGMQVRCTLCHAALNLTAPNVPHACTIDAATPVERARLEVVRDDPTAQLRSGKARRVAWTEDR